MRSYEPGHRCTNRQLICRHARHGSLRARGHTWSVMRTNKPGYGISPIARRGRWSRWTALNCERNASRRSRWRTARLRAQAFKATTVARAWRISNRGLDILSGPFVCAHRRDRAYAPAILCAGGREAGPRGSRSEPAPWEVSRIFRSKPRRPREELLRGPPTIPISCLRTRSRGLDRPTYRVELGSTQRSNKDSSVEG
jgi:hypothetical protein